MHVILFDDCISEFVLELARREANRIPVGTCPAAASLGTDAVRALAMQLAGTGKQVVCLEFAEPTKVKAIGEERASLGAGGINRRRTDRLLSQRSMLSAHWNVTVVPKRRFCDAADSMLEGHLHGSEGRIRWAGAEAAIRSHLLALVCLLLLPVPALAGAKETVAALAPSGLVLVLDEEGRELVAQNADRPFVPASVTKIVTAWLAMEVLGGDYRFETRFYLDEDRVLYVRGGGDPFLISEELALLAPRLVAATGKAPYAGIVLDASYYPADLRIPGIEATGEAYDALNAALAVNFNTIHAVRRGRTVRSAEAQTPITPLAIAQFRARAPNGRSRISLAQEDPTVSVRYAGELLAAFIERAGGSVTGDIAIGSVPEGLTPVYVHRQSRPLSEILRQMLIGSNNYIANQVFLEIGAHRLGGPVGLDKSLRIARGILAEHGLADSIRLEEGSGISRGNLFTARGLAEILHRFAPHAGLLRESRGGSRYKTGTFAGVSTLAGYANTARHGTARFVISLPGGTGTLRFRLLETLERGL